ncbi:acyl-CoA thioesterase [Mesoterricola sediminis]|uniref:Thioesterase n=1 Tax=Mesoterricola sediminis TaxID=2927980 RepID=A0AA48H340_9BACT|nr:thioesterase family protein [Mesoterricola sediminis]BDU78722.1 thioesterase [Mesoterricola sediminis]
MPFSLPIDVRFSDVDALGHVNHAMFIVYLEHARTRWWAGYLDGRPFSEEGFYIAHVEMDYRKPIHLGDAVQVEVRCVHVGNTSFTLAYRVTRGGDRVVLAEGQTVQVMVDLATGRPRPIRPQTQAWLQSQV